jgi:hypothetical protein
MVWLIACAFCLIVAGAAAVQFWAHMRTLDAHKQSGAPVVDADRYRPMLRLLSLEDTELLAEPALRRKFRTQRSDLFREYLRSLTRDYGKLLAEVRLIMTQSGIDRPDLAKALVRNQVLFAITLCRIDFRLRLYALGIGKTAGVKLDVLGLVNALNVMRGQFSFVESAVWGA